MKLPIIPTAPSEQIETPVTTGVEILVEAKSSASVFVQNGLSLLTLAGNEPGMLLISHCLHTLHRAGIYCRECSYRLLVRSSRHQTAIEVEPQKLNDFAYAWDKMEELAQAVYQCR